MRLCCIRLLGELKWPLRRHIQVVAMVLKATKTNWGGSTLQPSMVMVYGGTTVK